MINLELTWQQAAAASASVACVSGGLRISRRPRLLPAATFAQEASLVLGLFALWQLAGSFTVAGPGGALGRSRWIWHFERVIGLPSETSLQRIFLPHPLIVQFLNLYYDSMHFPVLIACMVWLFVWHRGSYRRLRTTVVAFTAACLLIQLMPVAPPRMMPSTGMVDTGVLYHQSVYTNVAGFNADQLSAMPSVHVGWAILVAVFIIWTASTRWRWLAVLYPALTTLAVIVTANHFWLDGIVAAMVLVVVLAGQHWARRLWDRRRPAAPAPQAAALAVADHHAQALGEHRR